MNTLESLLAFSPWMLVAARVGALVFTAPVVGSAFFPFRVRVLFSLSLSLVMCPIVASSEAVPEGVPDLFMGLAQEALIGSAMGLAMRAVVAVGQIAGSIIDSVSGLSIAALNVAGDASRSGAMASLFHWTWLAVFLSVGGLTLTLEGLLESFSVLAPGQAAMSNSVLEFLCTVVNLSFALALRATFPALIALVISVAVLALAQRSFPQLGSMQVALNVQSVLGVLAASVLLLTTPWLASEGIENVLTDFSTLLKSLSFAR